MDADLRGAILNGADLWAAKNYTDAQLRAEKSLKGAIMPDGRLYEEWIKDAL